MGALAVGTALDSVLQCFPGYYRWEIYWRLYWIARARGSEVGFEFCFQ